MLGSGGLFIRMTWPGECLAMEAERWGRETGARSPTSRAGHFPPPNMEVDNSWLPRRSSHEKASVEKLLRQGIAMAPSRPGSSQRTRNFVEPAGCPLGVNTAGARTPSEGLQAQECFGGGGQRRGERGVGRDNFCQRASSIH
ncbi:hypothetical protein GWK47_000247 [Chionoecetes opilio]|uniref:Uncharacterized protein n=1 Tax=Chionoecetes opilio TaxID=41210 RepID=A0A8J8WAC4_CHIOP|nr:hypothetical protein GWK47_000247 [Chionoecetes opilio]